MTECPFCKLVREGLPAHTIYEDDAFFVMLDRESLAPGHCLVVPRRHVARVYELDDTEYTALFQVAKRLAVRLQEATGAKTVAYVTFGSGLPHSHLHLVPHDDPDQLAHPRPRQLTDKELLKNAADLRPLLTKLRRGKR